MRIGAHILVGLFSGLLVATGAASCGTPSLDGCHQRMVEELGCCPMCESECQGAVDAACADDQHDPLADDEPDAAESSSEAGAAGDDDVSRPQ